MKPACLYPGLAGNRALQSLVRYGGAEAPGVRAMAAPRGRASLADPAIDALLRDARADGTKSALAKTPEAAAEQSWPALAFRLR
jgi:hypothetical protein